MDIKEIRSKISSIDKELVDLILQRMNLSLEVAQYKKENQLPVLDRTREREILLKVSENAGEDYEGYVRILFSVLFDLSKSHQIRALTPEGELAKEIHQALEKTSKMFPQRAVVACQGIEGAYSQQACDKLFSLPNIVYFRHFEGVFQAVQNGLCQYGILPIENSSFGSVTKVYDLMKNYHFHIVRSIKLCVSHTLLSKEPIKTEDIKEIFTHEQAVGQCSDFFAKRSDIKVTLCENTAVAAKRVAESKRKDIAAISSKNCAELYGLNVLSENVQNSDNNYTRFICISRNLEIYPGSNKISLMLTLPHRPSSLYTTISQFSALGLNLTKLESRPIPGKDFEFMFYFDMDASVEMPDVIRLLSKFESSPDTFVFLGAYSEIH